MHIDRIVIAWIAPRGWNIQRGHRAPLRPPQEESLDRDIIVFTPRVMHATAHRSAYICGLCGRKNIKKT